MSWEQIDAVANATPITAAEVLALVAYAAELPYSADGQLNRAAERYAQVRAHALKQVVAAHVADADEELYPDGPATEGSLIKAGQLYGRVGVERILAFIQQRLRQEVEDERQAAEDANRSVHMEVAP